MPVIFTGMLLESLYKLVEEQVDKHLSGKKFETDLEALYKFIRDEVKKALHLATSEVYAYQFDVLPKHEKLQNPAMMPFYIVVSDNGSGAMVNKDGDEVYTFNPLVGDDAFAAIAVYRNCFMYKTSMISPVSVPKKKY